MPVTTRDILPLVAWSLFVAFLLLVPGDLESDAPDWLNELAAAGADKLVHAALFFVQALCIARAWRLRGRAAWQAALVAAAYGLALELLQMAVPGRGWEPSDVVANAVGAFLWPVVSRTPWRGA